MQMQHMRAGRAPQVPVPPVSAAPLEISRETQQQLRLMRHSAFERHQENAQWTKELLDGSKGQNKAFRTSSGLTASSEELQKQIKAKNQAADGLESQLVQQQEAQQAAQRRFVPITDTCTVGVDAGSAEGGRRRRYVKVEKLEAEKKLLLPKNQRKMEIVRTVQENESKLLEPYAYISELPGKNVRGRMIGAFQTWLRAPAEAVESIQSIVDQLHNASLLIDDIEDDSEMRRGQPVAHHIFGVPATINCANYVYFLSLQRCQALDNPRALQVYTDEMLRLHQGQG
ncbi:Polyprenyl synthetase-related [Phytophthora cactorum]|nr:Polyprenyl synthetase-related [Phytophthora cactorum]